MVKAERFAISRTCRVSSKLARCRIFREIYHVSPLSTLGYCGIIAVSLEKTLHPQLLHFTRV